MSRFLRRVLFTVIILTMSGAYYGSFDNLLSRIKGRSIIAAPDLLDLGSLPKGTNYQSEFHLLNISGKEIRISGANTSCDCIGIVPDLPLVLKPGHKISLMLTLATPVSEGPFERVAELWSEGSMQSVVRLKMKGTVSSD